MLCVTVLKCAMACATSLTNPQFMQAGFVIALPLYIGRFTTLRLIVSSNNNNNNNNNNNKPTNF